MTCFRRSSGPGSGSPRSRETDNRWVRGLPFVIGWESGTWLDDERYAFWDIERRQFFVADADIGTTRVLEGVEGPANVCFAQQGRAMIVNRYRVEVTCGC